MNGQSASCACACPFGVDIRSILKKTAKGKLTLAAKEIRASIPFPEVVNALCPAPCKSACQRLTVMKEESVNIPEVIRACLDAPRKAERKSYVLPLTGKKAAVIGAGPAGLFCAYQLEAKRIAVTLFESGEDIGGSLRAHPEYESFKERFTAAFGDKDVLFRLKSPVTSLEELSGFDCVVIATGREGDRFGLTPLHSVTGHTERPGVFLAGEAAGKSLPDGMAGALDTAKAAEAYLLSGEPLNSLTGTDNRREGVCRYVPHDKDEPSEPVHPENGERYTPEEAQREAMRCMQCDCENCMSACELLTKHRKKPPRIAVDVMQDGQTRNSVSSATITRETWSCNLCGRCAGKCPEGVDLGELFRLSREDRVKSGNYPPAIHGYRLREMEFASGTGRLYIAGGEAPQYLFFPGCSHAAGNPDYVLAPYLSLTLNCPGTPLLMDCCGAPALWAGDRERFEKQLDSIRSVWEENDRPTFVCLCASCISIFNRFLPEIKTVSFYKLIYGKCHETGPFSVFDPCAARDNPAMREAVRKVAKEGGAALTDYSSDGKCCGFGGHMQLADSALYTEHTKAVCEETEDAFLVYCANCMDVFKAAGKDCRHILDLIYGLYSEPAHRLDERKLNILITKRELMKTYLHEEFCPEVHPWERLPVSVDTEAVKKLEEQLIPIEDVQKAVWECKESGGGFENGEGDILCSTDCGYITLWVTYREDYEMIRVTDVWSHRMKIRREG